MIKTVEQKTNDEQSIVTGCNGTHRLAAIKLWIGSRGELFIDGIGRSGKTLNAGFMIDAEATKPLLMQIKALL